MLLDILETVQWGSSVLTPPFKLPTANLSSKLFCMLMECISLYCPVPGSYILGWEGIHFLRKEQEVPTLYITRSVQPRRSLWQKFLHHDNTTTHSTPCPSLYVPYPSMAESYSPSGWIHTHHLVYMPVLCDYKYQINHDATNSKTAHQEYPMYYEVCTPIISTK